MMTNMQSRRFFTEKAEYIRKNLVEVAVTNDCEHIAPSLSCVEILVALYYGILNHSSNSTPQMDGDRVVFSKSHGAYALIAILADIGLLPMEQWLKMGTPQSDLTGCVERHIGWGIEAGCGALGHGLPIAVGMAYGLREQKKQSNVFCILGDGELQEGSNWEAMQFAVKHGLDNLILIVDRNGLQAMDFIEKILDKSPSDLARRFEGFGLQTHTCEGHDVIKLIEALNTIRARKTEIPQVLLAETIKGKGFNCMENVPKFHYRAPTEEELRNAGY
jgi:transketolase